MAPQETWHLQCSCQTGTFARTSIVAVFFFLPLLLRTVYGLFACVTLDRVSPNQGSSFVELNAPGSYWLLDTDQQCFKGYHKGWAFGLGVPLLLLLCVVVPFGIVGYLWRCRRKNVLGDAYYSQHYGFLYESYTRRCCFWEGVVAMQVRPPVLVAAVLHKQSVRILLLSRCHVAV